MGIKTSKLNCGGKGAKEEPYRSRSVTVKNVVKKTRVENGGDHVAGTDEVSKDVLKARNSKGQTSQGKQKGQNGGPKITRDTSTKETATHSKKVKETPNKSEPKPYEFVKGKRLNDSTTKTSKLGATTNDPDETALKSVTSRVGDTDETALKSVTNRVGDTDETALKSVTSQVGDTDETALKRPISSSNVTDTNESTLDMDCIPSLNIEERPQFDRHEEFADADPSEYNKQQEKIKKKSEGKHIEPEPGEDTEESEEDEDEDSEESKEEGKGGGRNYNFGHVTNMIIGTGKIIDRSTHETSKKNGKAKKQSKTGKKKTKGETVNAEDVRNLGIGTVVILDQSKNTEPPKPAREKVEKKVVPKTEVNKPIPSLDMKELISVEPSVGIIHGYNMNGTVFRVGKDKIMTAWHVVRGMLWVDSQSKKLDYERLAEVFVDFNYVKEYQSDHLKRFPLEPTVLYFDDKLDIAVLQLKPNIYGMAYPVALTKFDKFTPEVHEKYSIYLIGHSNSLQKSMDHVMKYWHPFDHRITELTDWSANEFNFKHGFGYTGIKEKTRLLFRCSFRHGASGCPGFLVRSEGDVRVVTVLLRGFPDFYYYDNFTEEEKNRVPTEKLIQQGANIGAIMEDMEKKNKELFREIFQYSDFISHSEKNQPLDTPLEEKVPASSQNPASTETENNPADSGDQVTCMPKVASEQDTQVMLASGKDTSHNITESESGNTSSSVGKHQPVAAMTQDQNGAHFHEPPLIVERLQGNTNMSGNEAESTENLNTDENGASSEMGAGSQSISKRNNAIAFSVQAIDDGPTDQGRHAAQLSPSFLNRQMSETTTSASEVLCAEIRQQAHSTKSASASKIW